MKILLVGASGTIGKAVKQAIGADETVVQANHSGGDVQVDLGSPDSVKAMFEAVGPVDAIISTAGVANFAGLNELTDADFELALQNKLMGQVNLIRLGHTSVNAGGSITLTSGLLAREPIPGSAVISMANGGLDSFVKAAALELGDSIRVNVVSPIFVKETMEMMGMDSTQGLSAADTAKAYIASLKTDKSGQVLDVLDFQ